MKHLGSLESDALVWAQGEASWQPLEEFLVRHPIPLTQTDPARRRNKRRSPSILRGFAGAFLGGILGGACIAGLAALTGALFTILWWGMAWLSGYAGREWAGKTSEWVGVFALVATLLGMIISFAGLEVRAHSIILFGGFGVLISFPGSLWLAFKTAKSEG